MSPKSTKFQKSPKFTEFLMIPKSFKILQSTKSPNSRNFEFIKSPNNNKSSKSPKLTKILKSNVKISQISRVPKISHVAWVMRVSKYTKLLESLKSTKCQKSPNWRLAYNISKILFFFSIPTLESPKSPQSQKFQNPELQKLSKFFQIGRGVEILLCLRSLKSTKLPNFWALQSLPSFKSLHALKAAPKILVSEVSTFANKKVSTSSKFSCFIKSPKFPEFIKSLMIFGIFNFQMVLNSTFSKDFRKSVESSNFTKFP